MLADPAFFAKPIHILKLEGGSDRFDRLHTGFIDAGAARWFAGEIDTWSYAPIREAERAAAEIRRLIADR
jgi:mitochondrial fission protein ELM1